MDDQVTQTTPTQPIMVDTMPKEARSPQPMQPSFHHKRKTGWIIILVILVLIIIGAVWYFYFHKKPVPLTPEQTLQALKASSAPVTATVSQRADTVNTLSKPLPRNQPSQSGADMLSELSK
jgi:flagellar basal body-associated protein FliL